MPQAAAQIIIPDDFPPVISGTPALQTMQAHGNVTVYTSHPETQDELVARIREAHTVVNIRAYCKFTAEVLQACPHLQHLAIWGTGTDRSRRSAARPAQCGAVSPHGRHYARSADERLEPVCGERRNIFTGAGAQSGGVRG